MSKRGRTDEDRLLLERMEAESEESIGRHWWEWSGACRAGFSPIYIPRELLSIIATFVWSARDIMEITLTVPMSIYTALNCELDNFPCKCGELREGCGEPEYLKKSQTVCLIGDFILDRWLFPATQPTLDEILQYIKKSKRTPLGQTIYSCDVLIPLSEFPEFGLCQLLEPLIRRREPMKVDLLPCPGSLYLYLRLCVLRKFRILDIPRTGYRWGLSAMSQLVDLLAILLHQTPFVNFDKQKLM